jgi:hypothetical protein
MTNVKNSLPNARSRCRYFPPLRKEEGQQEIEMENCKLTFLALSRFVHHHFLALVLPQRLCHCCRLYDNRFMDQEPQLRRRPIVQTKIHVWLLLLLLATISDVQNRLFLTPSTATLDPQHNLGDSGQLFKPFLISTAARPVLSAIGFTIR